MGFFDLFKRKKTEQPKVEESKPVESVVESVAERVEEADCAETPAATFASAAAPPKSIKAGIGIHTAITP